MMLPLLGLQAAPEGSPISPSTAVTREADVQVVPAFSVAKTATDASVGAFWLREDDSESREQPAAKEESSDLPQAKEFHRKDRAHFTPEGYDFLARYVAESIEGVLNIPAEQVP